MDEPGFSCGYFRSVVQPEVQVESVRRTPVVSASLSLDLNAFISCLNWFDSFPRLFTLLGSDGKSRDPNPNPRV